MTWRAVYEPLIGGRLEGFALMPITGDVPNVVSDLAEPTIWYSGAIRLGFERHTDLLLTWESVGGGDCYLTVGNPSSWSRFSLADLPMGSEERWAGLVGAELTSLTIYRGVGTEIGVGAVRHQFSNTRELWVAVGNGGADVVGEGDDLCVSLNPPIGAKGLSLQETIGGAS